MEYIEVTGGNPLRGSIRPAAAKKQRSGPFGGNAVVRAQPCTLRRVPLLRDVQTSLDLLRAVGSGAAWPGRTCHPASPADQRAGAHGVGGGYVGVGVLPGTAVDPRGLGRAAAARRVQTGAAAH